MIMSSHDKAQAPTLYSVRTHTTTKLLGRRYRGKKQPKYALEYYVRIYSGTHQDCHFKIKAIRFNEDNGSFEYYGLYGWIREPSLVSATSRQGWHYDSQGYCDNPGRGY